jgi:hypothetical protein
MQSFSFPTKGLQIFWKFSTNFQDQKIGKKEKRKP